MARRIPGEFVPLDLNLPRDVKIRRAGPDAELLYIRGLIYLKTADLDGFIPDFDLETVGAGCKKVSTSAQKLVEVGLWDAAHIDGMDGYKCRAWLKWNMSHKEMEVQRQQRRVGALKTNHDKGNHDSEPHKDCPLCQGD